MLKYLSPTEQVLRCCLFCCCSASATGSRSGPLLFLSYGVVFYYYFYSILLAVFAIQSKGHAQFFPVLYFVLPCILGTIVQGLYYGLSVGWLGASLAFFFVQMQLQNFNAFVDDLSTLYNRRYYNYLLDKTVKSRKVKSVSGIMIDVNHFKAINDQFGHTAGDDAIRALGGILSEITTERNTAFRLSGDEFVLLSADLSREDTEHLIRELQAAVKRFNDRGEKPYQLSLAVGYSVFSTENFDSDQFLHQMDMRMYADKAQYHSEHQVPQNFAGARSI